VSAESVVLLTGCETTTTHDVSSGATAPAVVIARDTVQVERIDAREQSQVFIGQEHRYVVAPGEHAWVIRYADIFYASDDTHDKVVSRPVRLTFVAEPGKQYAFTHVPQKTPESARIFARDPQVRVVTTTGTGVPVRTEVGEDTGFFTSGQVPVDRDAFVTDRPGNDGPAALTTLQEGWRRANEGQRRQFLEWIRSSSP
jgi:uncharacterized protein YccT (UPF0319 family)